MGISLYPQGFVEAISQPYSTVFGFMTQVEKVISLFKKFSFMKTRGLDFSTLTVYDY